MTDRDAFHLHILPSCRRFTAREISVRRAEDIRRESRPGEIIEVPPRHDSALWTVITTTTKPKRKKRRKRK